MKIYSKRLKKKRIEMGLTQQELGKEIYLSKSAISQYERGKKIPSLETLVLLSEFFNLDINYLLGREVKAVNGNDVKYISSVDLEIISSIQKNDSVYGKFIDNPTRMVDFIIKKL